MTARLISIEKTRVSTQIYRQKWALQTWKSRITNPELGKIAKNWQWKSQRSRQQKSHRWQIWHQPVTFAGTTANWSFGLWWSVTLRHKQEAGARWTTFRQLGRAIRKSNFLVLRGSKLTFIMRLGLVAGSSIRRPVVVSSVETALTRRIYGQRLLIPIDFGLSGDIAFVCHLGPKISQECQLHV